MKTAICIKYGPSQILLLTEAGRSISKDIAIPAKENHKAVINRSSFQTGTALKLFLTSIIRALTLILSIIIKTAIALLTSLEVLLKSVESSLN
jgi:hypothetical protein